jgi:Fe2+ transport system protein FeoA
MSNNKKLSELNLGDRAIVYSVSEKDKNLSTRLMSLGLVAMTTLEVVSVAPLGDPIMISFRDTVVSLRRSEAAGIEVQLVEEQVSFTLSTDNYHDTENFSLGELPNSSSVLNEVLSYNSFVLGSS